VRRKRGIFLVAIYIELAIIANGLISPFFLRL
jgi:hypothetical protein